MRMFKRGGRKQFIVPTINLGIGFSNLKPSQYMGVLMHLIEI